MPLTRRSVLFGSATAAFGLATGSCSLIDSGGGTSGELPSTKDVRGALEKLAKETGRETFQSVSVNSKEFHDVDLDAELLMDDGGVQNYEYDGSWKKKKYDEKTILTSPASVGIAGLPLDRLAAYAGKAGATVDTLAFRVDYVGKLHVEAWAKSDWVGLKADASGPVPELHHDDVAGVKAAIAEMVAVYGTRAERVGSFNEFVHMDADVDGCQAGVRIIRYPRIAAKATITQESRYDPALLFDPSNFDPTVAVTRKGTIAKEAGVEGTVWDWEYRRPPQGGAPLVSFGIGPKGPSVRVWLDADGGVAAVVNGECAAGSGWCPK
ncbi:hypothetical protein [Virgisporangium aurantiacum]|nr:hypothetical protein [Virgisporangium aurantiacum]